MHILLTHDDDIHVEGLVSLEYTANQLSDEVGVVASDTDQSCYTNLLWISESPRLRKFSEKRYIANCVPTDYAIVDTEQDSS